MHANASVPLGEIISVPPRMRRGRPWRMKSSCHACGRARTPARALPRRGESRCTRASSAIQSGDGYWRGGTGICEGHQSLKSRIGHCRLPGQRAVHSSTPLLRGGLLSLSTYFIKCTSLSARPRRTDGMNLLANDRVTRIKGLLLKSIWRAGHNTPPLLPHLIEARLDICGKKS